MYTTTHGAITTESSNIEVSEDGLSATVSTGEGVSYEIDAAAVYFSYGETISIRDSRADTVEVSKKEFTTEYRIGEVDSNGSNLVLGISGSDSFDRLIDKVEAGIQDAYDNGFEDGYTAGYDDGFAAAKGVVKN